METNILHSRRLFLSSSTFLIEDPGFFFFSSVKIKRHWIPDQVGDDNKGKTRRAGKEPRSL